MSTQFEFVDTHPGGEIPLSLGEVQKIAERHSCRVDKFSISKFSRILYTAHCASHALDFERELQDAIIRHHETPHAFWPDGSEVKP